MKITPIISSLLPTKKQWHGWKLPSKYTAIRLLLVLLTILISLGLGVFKMVQWAMRDEPEPEVSIDLEFPYERSGDTVAQNERNPRLTIANRGLVSISPLVVDGTMFDLSPALDRAVSAVVMAYKTHGHFMLQSEFSPGASCTASLIGRGDWADPAAYDFHLELVRASDHKKFALEALFLIDRNGIKGPQLDEGTATKIRSAISTFLKSKDLKTRMTLWAPIDGVWVPELAPGVDLEMNEDGSATVRRQR